MIQNQTVNLTHRARQSGLTKLFLAACIIIFLQVAPIQFGNPVSARAAEKTARKVASPISSPFVQFDLNIPGVTQEMLDNNFWASRIPDPDKVLLTKEEIERYNRKGLRECKTMKDLRSFRRILSGREVKELITKVSSRPKGKSFQAGKEIPSEYFDALESALNLEAVPESVIVRYGITVKRTQMRTVPTLDQVFPEADDYEFDRFIETALYPAEPLVVLHESSDNQWFFAQTYNSLAWVPVEDVALADHLSLFGNLDAKNSLVITGKKVFTGFNPFQPEISELQLDMGVRLPLATRDEIPMDISGQHPAGNYVVKLPARNPEGQLEWRLGLISRMDDVHVGPLPLTRRNLINQAFKFLGQRYGWGGLFNTRDCSSFIMDNFRSMGVLLPRNANEQGKLAVGVKHDMPPEMNLEVRKKLFDSLPPATPIYMDGHAMLYLWKTGGDYYIIHDFTGFNTPDEEGKLKRSRLRGVFVTPLVANRLSDKNAYMEGLYTAREFRLE